MPSFCRALGKIAHEFKWVDFDPLWQKRGKTPTTTPPRPRPGIIRGRERRVLYRV